MSTKQSIQPNKALPSGSSSVYPTSNSSPTSTFPLAVQLQPVQQDILRQSHAKTDEGASDGERSPRAATAKNHNHWCWFCKDPKPIKACAEYKRHVQSHYTRHYCIPPEAVRHTEDGRKCAFCSVSNPDARHLNQHHLKTHTPDCFNTSYTRKEPLSAHFKKVHAFDDGSRLAKDSKYTEKKHFACGFCGCYFNSPKEMANHVDASHYNLSQSNWDTNKVIRGLLSQNEQNKHWRDALAARNHIPEFLFTWDSTRVEELQQRLEMGREPPGNLVAAAIDQSNYSKSEYDHINPMPMTGFTGSEKDLSQTIQTFPYHTTLSPLLSTSNQGFATHPPKIVAPTLESQNWDGIHEGRPLHQFDPQAYGSSVGAMSDHADHQLQPHFSRLSGPAFEQQHPAYLPLMPSRGGTSDNSSLGGHLQGVSLNTNINLRSRPMAEAYNYLAQPYAGRLPPMLATEFVPSTLGQPTGTYNDHQYVDAQRSHQETIVYPDFEPNVNSDAAQRFIQYQDHTLGQR